ncbi:23S rRNA (guanosine2251-2'-O)-methyltransferase [Caloranaerobacter azorensis DSM 13643]|uniref:23S rRNA (Guanosine2251-2'-O)-methyltransferase n=1 Tax=Caloranaerobacter azorensis DSM 13643 TaxID=1121264 RepID=A0A1M5WC55_9FIRM|nr:23S rRNA (guanosine(2251)-2'-O)-methyltransferase RlmB [Caloranaerobacter azorensis]SHH85086.1 23S rRNA (guanosine2251-2'-O)-methyltransferase [Caloranaerobacter azorensis DSM 13643]
MQNRGLIEGRNPVLEALKSNRNIEKIMIAKGAEKGSIKKIKAIAKERGIVIQYVDRNKLDSISYTSSHQGVIAIASAYEYKTVEDILNYAENLKEDPFIIILEGVKDPHNLGAIMRTAECAGAHGIIIPKRRSVGLTPVVAKSSAGAIEYLPIAKVSNIVYTIEKLKENGIWVCAADMDGESNYYEKDLRGPLAIVIGSEGEGISRLVKEKCDFLVKIPMKGKVTSLNASVAASILIYEVLRQRSLGR